ncbi:MAG: circularization family protein [Bradyrhizobium sp.]|nr:circularization family protein [Bradyrhizobium sp.]
MNIGGGAGAVLGTASGIGNLAQSLAARLGGTALSYQEQLRPASFRQMPFVSLGGESGFGRRNAVHEYPKRDTPWIEDLGRAARRFQVIGYLVGDDVIQRRDVMIQMCETKDDGELIHATLGRRTVSILDFRTIERWDKGRYFELQFDFMEAGQQLFPTSASSSSNAISSAISALGLSAAADFASRVLTAIAKGASVVGMAVSTALTWYTNAKNLVGDARNLVRLVFALPGNFGRFAGSATVPTFSKYQGPPTQAAGVTTADLIAQATVNRAAVSSAAVSLGSAATGLDASSTAAFATAAQNLASAVLAAAPDPADGLRLLAELANFYPAAATTNSPIGTGMATMQAACGDLFRRAALATLAQASSTYQPTSADDAMSTRNTVTTLLDAEILVAGDQGEDQTYEALRALREAVVQDLNTRGAGLASITTISLKGSMPALVLANQLYRDASRADEIVAQGSPIHPAFMPKTFKALSS